MSHHFDTENQKRAGRRLQSDCSGRSRTQQHHAKECDITRIISRYARTGEFPPVLNNPQFGDVTHLQGDITERLETARSTIQTAQSDLAAHHQKLAAEKQQKINLQKQKQAEQKQREERVSALKQELADLEGPPS